MDIIVVDTSVDRHAAYRLSSGLILSVSPIHRNVVPPFVLVLQFSPRVFAAWVEVSANAEVEPESVAAHDGTESASEVKKPSIALEDGLPVEVGCCTVYQVSSTWHTTHHCIFFMINLFPTSRLGTVETPNSAEQVSRL